MMGYECGLTAFKQHIKDQEVQQDLSALPKNVFLNRQLPPPPTKLVRYLCHITV